MAIAKIIPPVPAAPLIQLTLSAIEAETLLTIMRRIGGGKETGREHTDAILQTLRNIGVEDTYTSEDFELQHSAIIFKSRGVA